MNRRDFFTKAGLGSYSLIVLGDDAEAQTAPPHPDFDRIAPPRASPAPTEPHMRLVSLDADVLVAGGGLAGVCATIAAVNSCVARVKSTIS